MSHIPCMRRLTTAHLHQCVSIKWDGSSDAQQLARFHAEVHPRHVVQVNDDLGFNADFTPTKDIQRQKEVLPVDSPLSGLSQWEQFFALP